MKTQPPLLYGTVAVKGLSLDFYSRALLCNFYLLCGPGIMFDCGDGAAPMLEQRIFKVKHLFLSHHHVDHAGGLPGMLYARNTLPGDKEKPLHIYYPGGNGFLAEQVAFFANTGPELGFPVYYHPLQPGQKVAVDARYQVQAYAVEHEDICLAYLLYEQRRQWPTAYAALSAEQIKRHKTNSGSAYQDVDVPIVFYSGDMAVPCDGLPQPVVTVLVDSTFLSARDRMFTSHLAVEEFLNWAGATRFQDVLYVHLSRRYTPDEAIAFIAGHGQNRIPGSQRLLWANRCIPIPQTGKGA